MDARTSEAPILVTGGTGTLGRLVVARLRDTGRDVVVLSRGRREHGDAIAQDGNDIRFVACDLATGDGIEAALEGVETVLHLAGSAKGDEVKAQHLVGAASRARVKHMVCISVVGADTIPVVTALDRMMFGYFASKLAAERIVAGSGLPWTTLRATQFHQLTLRTIGGMARMPVIPVPAGFSFQPIDADEVAARLVELALGAPAGLVPDIAGPRAYEMNELIRGYLQAVGKHRLLVPMHMPGGAARAIRSGANLAPDRAVGRRSWEAFLADWVSSGRDNMLAAA
jgi:uncharacterized protein YbjT (DUF2867 family)